MIFHFLILLVNFVFLLIEFHCTFFHFLKNSTILCSLLSYFD